MALDKSFWWKEMAYLGCKSMKLGILTVKVHKLMELQGLSFACIRAEVYCKRKGYPLLIVLAQNC